MWDRKELKARGKSAFKANYWKSVLVALILLVLVGGTAGSISGSAGSAAGTDSSTQQAITEVEAAVDGMTDTQKGIMVTALLGAFSVALAVGILFDILLINPVVVGCYNFFMTNSDQPAELDAMGRGFKPGYGNNVKTMLIKDLFLCLWGLLFIIPAIVKSYSYRMVPYILADHPEMGGTQVITLSRQMMQGHKWKAFVLDLSFLGWDLLTALTFGLVGVFYAGPYKCATDAELYLALRK